jgi:hypothetical protein
LARAHTTYRIVRNTQTIWRRRRITAQRSAVKLTVATIIKHQGGQLTAGAARQSTAASHKGRQNSITAHTAQTLVIAGIKGTSGGYIGTQNVHVWFVLQRTGARIRLSAGTRA